MTMVLDNRSPHTMHHENANNVRARICAAVFTALLISTLFLLMFYPGFLSRDSANSWQQAVTQNYDTIKPPLMAIIQRAFFLSTSTGEAAIASFSFVQGALLWSAIFVVIAVSIRSWFSLAVCSALMLCLLPLWVHTNVHWTDVWVFAFAVFGLLAFNTFYKSGFTHTKWLIIGTLLFFISISIRYNAISSLPLVAVVWFIYIGKRHNINGLARVAVAAAICVILALGTKASVLMPGVEQQGSMLRFALFNQYLGTIVNSNSELQEKLIAQEKPYYDAAFGDGALEASIPLYLYSGNGLMFWPKDALIGFDRILKNGQFIIDRLPMLIWESPTGFIRHKFAYIRGQIAHSAEYFPMHPYVDPNILNVTSSPIIPGYRWTVETLISLKTSLLFKHWPSILLGVIGFVFCLKNRNALPCAVYVFGLLYTIPYLLSETGLEWRYLLPMYISGYLTFFVAVADSIERIFDKTRPMSGDMNLLSPQPLS
ncbi:putative membrane protein [Brucella rhizosphaerae]|uniref:Putative membrane protein n=1 Tax=Brucella rhizosphaerae TaxID=571254 RepID=A0A256FL22_9HYPH|nr:putative membrane protein [Brucella rhizosphaerae]